MERKNVRIKQLLFALFAGVVNVICLVLWDWFTEDSMDSWYLYVCQGAIFGLFMGLSYPLIYPNKK